ncbi:MAG: hypothetical protein UV57_C0006G0028, partial [Parcubacteria group bacterium GW2011_GWD2_43_10]
MVVGYIKQAHGQLKEILMYKKIFAWLASVKLAINQKQIRWYRLPVVFTLLALLLQPIHPAPGVIEPAQAGGGHCQIIISKTVDKATAVPGDI